MENNSIQSYVGEITHGQTGTALYLCWKNMRSRCYNENSDRYIRYGGRGISICKDWDTFINFYNWASLSGYSDNLTIDRIDVNDNYNPENCRWIPYEENSRLMMEYSLLNRCGIFSEQTQEKSKTSNRKNNGKPIKCERNGVINSFASRGEMIEYLCEKTNRKKQSIKSHISLCLRGKSETLSGYKIYE